MSPGDHPEEPSGGVGICVSGGGLRAASFGLGALQALQHERGLLRGEGAARYLSAVSGGSYIAGAYTLLNCSDRIRLSGEPGEAFGAAPGAGPESPFAPGTKEAEHLRRHCRYMVEDGGLKMSALFAGLIVLNLVAVMAIVIFAGVYLGDMASLVSRGLPNGLDLQQGAVWLQWVAAAISVGAIFYLGRLVDAAPTTPRREIVRFLVVLLVALAGCGALVARLESIPVLESPAWAIDHAAAIGVGFAILVGAVGITALLSRRFRHVAFLQRLTRIGTGLLSLRLVQLIGLLIVSWCAVAVYQELRDPNPSVFLEAAFLLAFAGPLLVSHFVDRASPHHIYRDLLNRCFSVIRDSSGAVRLPADPRGIKLSDLRPPENPGPGSFPELLICAAVNVSDIGATPAGSNALSLVFTPHEMTIPAVRDATLEIDDLERFQRPTDLGLGWGPAVNLSSAIAMTGAAVSPAMGKHTRNDLRALFASLNIRLGVWLPNPLNREVRETVSTRKPRIAVGPVELVRELFGFHSGRSDKIYVTDGGHYDNLGLLELMRRRCEEIWCIDASGDRPGRATALAEAILTAAGELGASVDIDLDAFARTPDSSFVAPDVNATHAVGTIRYADGSQATLTVVKLGITERTPSELREYRRTDRSFPYHSTVNQVYRADRFDAYRALGWASTHEAIGTATSDPLPSPDAEAQASEAYSASGSA